MLRINFRRYFLLAGFCFISQTTLAQTITSVAGGGPVPSGIPPYTSEQIGDSGPATSAYLKPFGVSTISERIGGVNLTTLYIADKDNNRIRKVAPDGIITTVVGNGVLGEDGDGGPAIDANLNGPEGVAAVKENISGVLETVLYISDTGNHRIRRAIVGGNIETFAGGGSTSPSGSDEGVVLPATSVSLLRPSQIVAIRGYRRVSRRWVLITRVYFADTANSLIRKVENGNIRVVAGRVPSPFEDIETVTDGITATEAILQLPFGLAVRSTNSRDILYISDANHYCVRKVQNGIITTYAGGGSMEGSAIGAEGTEPTDLHIHLSHGLALQGRTLYISDAAANRLYKVARNSVGSISLTNYAGNGEIGAPPYGDDGPALEAQTAPKGLDVNKWGELFIADTARGLIRKVAP